MKGRLTSIANASNTVASELDGMRVGVMRGLVDIEAELGKVQEPAESRATA
jgi:hypothetical protein